METYKKLHVDFSPFHLYVASLYWGMCNLALQAAGGALTPDTDLEFVYSIFVKFIALGYVVMTVSTLSASFVYRKKDDVSHEIKLDGYRSMFKTLRLNKRHQTRVNVYWTEFRTVSHIIEFDHYLSALPDHTVNTTTYLPFLLSISISVLCIEISDFLGTFCTQLEKCSLP